MTLARNGDFMYVPTNLRVELYRAKTSLLSDYTPDLTKPANKNGLTTYYMRLDLRHRLILLSLKEKVF